MVLIFLFVASGGESQTLPDASATADLRKTNTEIVRLYGQKKYAEALPLAQKAVQLSEQQFGRDNLETAKALRNLGFVQNAGGDAKAAENTFESALSVYKKFPDLNKQNDENLTDLIEAAAVIKYGKRMDSAESLFEQALTRREKTGSAESIKIAVSLSALANINYWRKDYKKAAALLERLLEVSAKNSGAASPESSLAYHRTECAYRKAGMEKDFQPIEEKYSLLKSKTKDAAEQQKDASYSKLINKAVLNGTALKLAKPAYPVEARQASAEGEVKIKVLINEDGNVIHACAVTKNHPALVESSEVAAYQSKFAPTTLEGKPVRVFGIVVYNYKR